MSVIFTDRSPYKKRARFLAIGWTLLIFILCFLPGDELPRVNIPFIDKWTHIILFGVFSFLWLCSSPTRNLLSLFLLLIISFLMGWFVEYVQGHYVQGRTQDNMDTLADTVGGLAGIIIFYVGSLIADNKWKNKDSEGRY